jgi:hypothetical protein
MPDARWTRRIAQVRHSEGTYGVLRFLGTRVLRLYRRRVFVCNLDGLRDELEGEVPSQPPEVLYLTSDDDLRRQHRYLQMLPPGGEEYLDGIRSRNTRGLLLLLDDTPAHWAFVMRASRTSTLLGFERDALVLGNDFTVPAFRQRGLQTCSVRLRLQEAKRWGAVHAIAETAMDNDFSARGLTRGGMSELGSVTVCVVLNHFVIRIGRQGYHPRIFGYSA